MSVAEDASLLIYCDDVDVGRVGAGEQVLLRVADDLAVIIVIGK